MNANVSVSGERFQADGNGINDFDDNGTTNEDRYVSARHTEQHRSYNAAGDLVNDLKAAACRTAVDPMRTST
uniref:Uncharacterized protein n=1 Tax=Parascaris equorum TaxID=6256 RepID=A0A914S6H9_PAREQ